MRLALAWCLLPLVACAPRREAAPASASAANLLPDVRLAPGRPPVVLIAREGDPAAAVALAIATAGIGFKSPAPDDDPDAATALAGVVEARLRARAIDAVVTPAWDGVRASALASSESESTRIASAFYEVLSAAIGEPDVVAARRKLAALALRPLRDKALGRWARCVGQPFSTPERAGKDYGDLDAARLERWRSSAAGLERVAIAVAGPRALAESVATAVRRGPAWSAGSPLPTAREAPDAIEIFEAAAENHTVTPAPTIHATLDVGTSSAAVTTAEALGDARGPLAARLSELDPPFRLREVTGGAHVRGGCVGVTLEASAAAPSAPADLAARVADAVALVELEAGVHLGEIGAARDGRMLSRLTGDAREAAERAAWWALVDRGVRPSSSVVLGSVALGLGSRRGSTARDTTTPDLTRESLASALARAHAAWDKPVVDARTRVEAGQGEVWVLVGSPCGPEAEGEGDAGVTALFTAATADIAESIADVHAEPWVVSDGAGLLVHGPALAAETPAAHARRLADVAARSFAVEPITNGTIARSRADLLRRDARNDGSAMSVLATALAPQHPSWVIPWGSSEPLARSADGSVTLRSQAVRAGPIRVAVLANADPAQADAAVRAADRWIARRSGEPRACRAPTGAPPPRPGTYAAPARPGAVPEAYLAFPFAPFDEAARAAALLVASALEGDGGLMEKALGTKTAAALAREGSARVLGWPHAPALVLRVVGAQASLDDAVMQVRSLVDRIHKGGLAPPDLDRATAMRSRDSVSAALDPRARIVATWRGDANGGVAKSRVGAEDVRAFAQRALAEDAMVVVASRPPRSTP